MFRRSGMIVVSLVASLLSYSLVARGALKASSGNYTLHGTAAKKTVDVTGKGTFSVSDDGNNVVFTSLIGKGKPFFDMGERNGHARDKFKLTDGSVLTLTVPKANVKFPEPGQKTSGQAQGKLKFAAGEQSVNIAYTAKESGGKFVIESANFAFDYTKHRAEKEQICLAVICVAEMIDIKVANVTVESN